MQDKHFSDGTLVQIWNREHVWHKEIAIVRNRKSQKTGFHRLEFMGSLKWIPTHWLVEIDE
jgi:hypothetical protein